VPAELKNKAKQDTQEEIKSKAKGEQEAAKRQESG
jgi:hypothetical protein